MTLSDRQTPELKLSKNSQALELTYPFILMNTIISILATHGLTMIILLEKRLIHLNLGWAARMIMVISV